MMWRARARGLTRAGPAHGLRNVRPIVARLHRYFVPRWLSSFPLDQGPFRLL